MRVPDAIARLWARKRYTPLPYQSFALYGGRLYFPTIGATPNGVQWEIEPVKVMAPDREALTGALEQAFSRKPQKVREYLPGDPPMKSPVQVAARCRSWISFARGSLRYSVCQSDSAWVIRIYAGPTPDETESRALPRESPPSELAAVALELADRYPLWRTAPTKTR